MKIYQNLAESIAKFLSPLVEVSLMDKNKKSLATYNRLTSEPIPSLNTNQCTLFTTHKNQSLKAMLIPLEDGYSLRMISDVSLFDYLFNILEKFLSKKEKNSAHLEWQSSIDKGIELYLEKNNLSLQALNSQGKRSLLLALHHKGLLRYQDATNYLASKFSVSRATIYNYLNQANQIYSLQVHQVDTFTDEPFSGNPAGVVLEANGLSEVMMKKITREMNCSETSFVFESKIADIKLRYFTPSGCEVKFCGHSTAGALYMLAHNKMLAMEKPGSYSITIETKVGILSAYIMIEPNDAITISFQKPTVDLINSHFIKQNKLINHHLKTIRVEQGHFIQRPDYVDLDIAQNPALVIAKAKYFFSTEITL
ncbi:MAG: PhzF family phenazine biosynthesis isomerase [Gammaproteobacteria bacterium]